MFDFECDGPGFSKGGTDVLSVDGKEVARDPAYHQSRTPHGMSR
jgi:hypothetical protein